MAEKKYPGDEAGLEKLKAKIVETGGPVAHGVTVLSTRLCKMLDGEQLFGFSSIHM